MEFTYKGRDFYLNGEKFIVRCGAMHYFRTPKYYWYDRLLKLKECGFNAVDTYVAWNIHEPKEGTYHFDGDADFAGFWIWQRIWGFSSYSALVRIFVPSGKWVVFPLGFWRMKISVCAVTTSCIFLSWKDGRESL